MRKTALGHHKSKIFRWSARQKSEKSWRIVSFFNATIREKDAFMALLFYCGTPNYSPFSQQFFSYFRHDFAPQKEANWELFPFNYLLCRQTCILCHFCVTTVFLWYNINENSGAFLRGVFSPLFIMQQVFSLPNYRKTLLWNFESVHSYSGAIYNPYRARILYFP